MVHSLDRILLFLTRYFCLPHSIRPRSSPVQSPKPRSRPVSAHKVPPAHSIHTVEKVSVSEDDINSAFTHVHISNMRSKSIAVVRLQSLHRSVTEARGEFDGCAIIAVS